MVEFQQEMLLWSSKELIEGKKETILFYEMSSKPTILKLNLHSRFHNYYLCNMSRYRMQTKDVLFVSYL
jgi:PIN domain nuclease of toxin-antitoxin system